MSPRRASDATATRKSIPDTPAFWRAYFLGAIRSPGSVVERHQRDCSSHHRGGIQSAIELQANAAMPGVCDVPWQGIRFQRSTSVRLWLGLYLLCPQQMRDGKSTAWLRSFRLHGSQIPKASNSSAWRAGAACVFNAEEGAWMLSPRASASCRIDLVMLRLGSARGTTGSCFQPSRLRSSINGRMP